MPTLDDLRATLPATRQSLDEAHDATWSAYAQARDDQHRLALATALLDADVAPGSFVATTSWPEEPNADGTYDIDPTEVYDQHGTYVTDIGGRGALPAGRCDDSGAWDTFAADPATVPPDSDLADRHHPDDLLLSASQVYDWLASHTTPTT